MIWANFLFKVPNDLKTIKSTQIRLGATVDDTILLNVPFYHCFGCVLGSLTMTIRGSRLVVPAPTFDSTKGLKLLKKII